MPNNFNQYQPYTGFNTTDPNTGVAQDLGQRYTSKSYLIDAYPNLIPGRTSPGLWSWGQNLYGQLGDGTRVPKSSPVQVGTLTNWKQVAGVGYHNAAIKTDGTLWTWGTNTNGELGDGTTVAKSSPVQVGALTNWKLVAGGGGASLPPVPYWIGAYTAAIKTDGTLWLWGSNSDGQLGDGTTVAKSSPVQVGALTNWKQVAVGAYHTAAIKTDGTLWLWGSNNYGQLGDGTTVAKSSPVQIGALTNWKQVAAGNSHTAAIKTDGTLWLWGQNRYYGQLGDGTRVPKSSPVQIGALTNWKQVACGGDHTAAIKTDGTLWLWGRNNYTQLGDGYYSDKSSPVQIGTLTNWKLVAGGSFHTAAIKTDGTLWTWGRNNYGQLGNGTGVTKNSPVQVGTLTNWKQVAGGSFHTAAISDGSY